MELWEYAMFKTICKHFKYGQKGFTIFELIGACAILGVLAAVVIR
jgi:prepilin-type N-terminal cleavage/methylation domain-containing protein